MKLKTRWLATVSLTTLVLVAAGSLSKTSQQLWSPEVAHAARVTASLLKGSSIRPVFLQRGSHLPARSIASFPLAPNQKVENSECLQNPDTLVRCTPAK